VFANFQAVEACNLWLISYNILVLEIRETAIFSDWLHNLRDFGARARIAARVRRLAFGNFGDAKPIGGGLSELRIHHGPGYRVYFVRRGEMLILLLCGGDKSSQVRDIAAAKLLAKDLKE
jgi:putative addiction module killer protein